MTARDGRDDDVVLRRSWDELHRDVVARGRTLRRRRRVLTVAPAVALVLAAGAGILALDGDDQLVETRADPVATTIPATPRIAFVRTFEGGAEGSAIFAIDLDGTDLAQLSVDPSWNDGSPSFSTDGEWIAFQSERDNPLRGVKRVTDIYVMRADGTDVRRVTTTTDAGKGNGVRHPAWSPDGSRLVVAREDASDNSQILTLAPDGTDERVLTAGPGDVGPVWSADGEWIAFRRRPTGEPEALWVVRPDGTDARRVVAEIHDGPLAWTPDGRITFVDTVADGARRLFTIALDGSDRRLLVDGESAEHAGAVWSPDGDRVVFTDDPDGQLLWDQDLLTGTTTTVGGRAPGRLVVADASGHVLRTLTEPAEGDHDGSPSWSRPL